MKNNEAYKGTDLKFVFESDGAFSFVDHDWEMTFYVNDKSVHMTKHNVQGGGYEKTCDRENMGFLILPDGRVVFMLDTSYLGAGRLNAELVVHLPDVEFATLDKMRDEVHKFNMMSVLP